MRGVDVKSSKLRRVVLLALAATLAGGCGSPPPPSFQTGRDVQPSNDGLLPLLDGRFDRAWALEGSSFDGFEAVWPVFIGIAHRAASNERSRQAQHRLPEQLRDDLMDAIEDIFRKEIGKKGWRLSGEKGPGTLLARVSLTDLVLRTPIRQKGSGREILLVQSVGSLTVVVDLFDSEAGTHLARAGERRSIRTESGRAMRPIASVTRFEAGRIFRGWARKLVSLLDGLRQADLVGGTP
jgi:hypothetical protein